MSDPIGHEQLERLFTPKSVAFIGASDKSLFSWLAFNSTERFGTLDRTHMVNPNRREVHGLKTYASCTDVPGGIDCAYVMVPQKLVPQTIDEAAAAGARVAVVVTSGYAEVGEAGARAQLALAEQCERNGMILLGPNHLGFANVGAGDRGVLVDRGAHGQGQARVGLSKRSPGEHVHPLCQAQRDHVQLCHHDRERGDGDCRGRLGLRPLRPRYSRRCDFRRDDP